MQQRTAYLPGELVQIRGPRRFWSSWVPGANHFFVKNDIALCIATVEHVSQFSDATLLLYLMLTKAGLGWTKHPTIGQFLEGQLLDDFGLH